MNGLYLPARSLFLTGALDWTAGTWKVEFLDDTYTFDETEAFLDVIPGGSRLSTPATLTGMADFGGGVADADDIAVGPVLTLGQTATHLIIYKSTGVDSTSPLVAHIDTNDDGTPMSYDGSGVAVPIVWPSSSSRIFKL